MNEIGRMQPPWWRLVALRLTAPSPDGLEFAGFGTTLQTRSFFAVIIGNRGRILFMENKMRRMWHPSAAMPARLEALRQQVRQMPIVALLLFCGVLISFAPVLKAQTPIPAVSMPGFIPATPFRNRNGLPPYPDDALDLGETGVVSVRISIAETGRVSEAKVFRSSGSSRLDTATARWIATRWQYHPATLNGRPVASTIQLRVTFAIKK